MNLSSRRELAFWICFAIALAFHGAAAAFFVVGPRNPGAGSMQTAAVSLNLVETLIVESAEPTEPQETASDDVEVNPEEGTIEDSAPSPAQMETEKEEQKEKAKAAGQDEAKPENVKPKNETKRKSQPSKASKKGGAQARGKTSKKRSGGQASASAGSVRNYAARVRAKVARNRPRGVRARGTAVVSFGVSRSGGLRYARLSRSSGNGALDSAALSAVRRASPFPTPPRGASLRQLSFRIPFHFNRQPVIRPDWAAPRPSP